MSQQPNMESLSAEIYQRKRKLIGWGTGSVFRCFLGHLPVEPKYLIDNDPQKWGKEILGIPVYSPEKLKEEDPQNIAIVIYSSFIEQISEQIKTLGDYAYLPAGVLSGMPEMTLFTEKMKKSQDTPLQRNTSTSSNAVVIQGPLTSDFNIEIIRHYGKMHPNDRLILSTWEATNPLFLKNLESVVDDIVLSTPPAFNGYQNRNYQITSTLAGLKKAKELGIENVLKTRTDIALLSENILEACQSLSSLYNNEKAQEYGLNGRIIIPETYTRKYLLYHPGDLVMYGNIDDMLKYWSAAHDTRKFSLMDDDWKMRNIREISQEGGPTESYLAREFAKTIHLELKNILEDYWNFLRDFYIVVDNTWFDLFWTKYPRLTAIETQNTVLNCVSHCFWHKLYFNQIDKERELSLVDIENTQWANFYEMSKKTG